MKMRILSRARALKIMYARMIDRSIDASKDISNDDRDLVDFSMCCYMLADGKEIKIYDDVSMGGTVVEFEG